jgi:hypothetical protein
VSALNDRGHVKTIIFLLHQDKAEIIAISISAAAAAAPAGEMIAGAE